MKNTNEKKNHAQISFLLGKEHQRHLLKVSSAFLANHAGTELAGKSALFFFFFFCFFGLFGHVIIC